MVYFLALVLVVGVLPTVAGADAMKFKVLTNYSQASFRSDAPLETFVGTSALEGIRAISPSIRPSHPAPRARSRST